MLEAFMLCQYLYMKSTDKNHRKEILKIGNFLQKSEFIP